MVGREDHHDESSRLILGCPALQVRSHAQKFFLKLEKAGKADVVPPPRPKKRAAKPYPVQSVRNLPCFEHIASLYALWHLSVRTVTQCEA